MGAERQTGIAPVALNVWCRQQDSGLAKLLGMCRSRQEGLRLRRGLEPEALQVVQGVGGISALGRGQRSAEATARTLWRDFVSYLLLVVRPAI